MGTQGKTEVIRSLDSLIYCHIAYSYFLDASLVALILRAFLQLPLLSARTANQTLQTAIMVTTIGFLICLLIHGTSTPGQPGLLIDFVGNQNHASILRVILVDIIIYVLQLIRIFATTSTDAGAGTVAQPPVSALNASNLEFVLPPPPGVTQTLSGASEEQDLFYSPDLAVDIELRPSFHFILSQAPIQQDPIDQLPV